MAQPPAVASTGGSATRTDLQLKSLADSVRRQISTSTAPAVAGDASGKISGPADIAPSLEQQLDFSSRGATHSVAVPLSELKSFLEQAALASGQSTSLRIMPGRHAAIAGDALSAWVDERGRLQRALERLQKASPDAVVIIPVIIGNN